MAFMSNFQRSQDTLWTLAADTGPATSAEIAIEIADSVRKADAAEVDEGARGRGDGGGAAEEAEVPLTGGEPREQG